MNPDLDNDFEDLDNEISRLLGAEPWARQKEEGSWEYAGFQIYRNAGSKRTLQMVAHGIEAKRHDARMKANIVEPSPSLGEHEYGQILKEVEQWERKNHWARRSKAWDAEMHEQYEELARCDEIKNDKSEDEAGSALLAIAAIHPVHLNKSLKDPEKLLELASLPIRKQLSLARSSARLSAAIAGSKGKEKRRKKAAKPEGGDPYRAPEMDRGLVLDQILERPSEVARLAREAAVAPNVPNEGDER